MRRRNSLVSLLLLITTIGYSLTAAPIVRGALVGTVCIVASGTAGCPSSPSYITASSTLGSAVTVAVNVQGSDSLNGFQISVISDPTVLNPISISFAGTVVPGSPIILVDCVNNVTQSGGACQKGIDGNGVASLGILAFAQTTVPPTTGLFFTITYNATGRTAGSPISFVSSSNCSGESVSGTNDCVLVTDGAATVPESDQQATFINTPTFVMSASPTSLTIPQGFSNASIITSTITVKSIDGFIGTVKLGAAATPSVTYGPSGSMSVGRSTVSSVTLTSRATSILVTLKVLTQPCTPVGLYQLTVTGTNGTSVRTANVSVSVTASSITGFCLAANPASLRVLRPGVNSTMITITSANGFTGKVSIAFVAQRGGPAAVLSASSVVISPGVPASVTLTVTTSAKTAAGLYTITVTGSSGKLLHWSVFVPVTAV